jgi:hypothetical protein
MNVLGSIMYTWDLKFSRAHARKSVFETIYVWCCGGSAPHEARDIAIYFASPIPKVRNTATGISR